MRENFTDKFIKNLKPAPEDKRVEHWDTKVRNFGVRVSDSGLVTYILYLRWPGKKSPTRRKIGRADRITLAAARATAKEWLAQVEMKVDPKLKARADAAEAARRAKVTFAVVAEDWFREIANKQRKAHEATADVRREFVGPWGRKPITDITTLDVVTIIRAKKEQGHAAQARNLLGYCKRLFDWAIEQHCYGVEESPAEKVRAIKLIGKKNRRQRVLTDDELRKVWQSAMQMNYPYAQIIRLMILTGQRKSEIGEAKWSEFDLRKREWIIPGERMKMGKPHLVPLTQQVLDVLAELPKFKTGDYLFSASYGRTPVNGFSKAKERLDKLTGKFEKPYVFHDLRRTMRSHLEDERLGVRERVAEAMIAHTPPGIIGTYVVYKYVDEKRRGFEVWHSQLARILQPGSNVVALQRARPDSTPPARHPAA